MEVELVSQSLSGNSAFQPEYMQRLYRRHIQGAYVRSGASLAMWLFAWIAFFLKTINFNHFLGISISIAYLVLINLPTLWMMKRSAQITSYKFLSILINTLEAIGYTAIIYFLGGIESAYLISIYCAFITYVGIAGTKRSPYLAASLCAFFFSSMAILQHFGILPSQNVIPDYYCPWPNQIMILLVSIGALYLIAFIASYTANLLKGNKEKLRRRNAELVYINEQFKKEIAEREHADAESKKAKEAAEIANRAKSDFLARMSHEIRTPLNGVLGITELLLETELDRKQRKLAETVDRSGKALLSIINDILDFSKIEAGKMELESVDFNLQQILQEIVRLFSLPASRKGLKIVLEIQNGVPLDLKGDPLRIRQILSNLISNAIKFTPRGEVTVRVLTEGLAGKTARLLFEVQDTGPGIPIEEQEKIFDPFAQGNDRIQRTHKGTGLGLAICRQFAEMMGGRIGVKSELGKGSTFWVSLHLLRQRTAHPESPDEAVKVHGEEGPVLSSPRVLVVDDNSVDQIVAVGMLESLDCLVDVVGNGKEAVEAMSQRAYDIVFMDCQMSEMDGWKATRAIRKREKEENARVSSAPSQEMHTVIIALTADALGGIREKCLAAGMDDYLSKPITKDQLLAILRARLPKGSVQSEAKIQRNTMKKANDLLLCPSPEEKSPLDSSALNQIRALDKDGTSNLVEEVIHLYLRDAPELKKTMAEAGVQGEADVLRRAAHTFKSISATVGALGLAELCKELETRGKEGKFENIEDVLTEVEEEYRRVSTALQKETGRIAAG